MFGLPIITCAIRMLFFLLLFRKDSIPKFKVYSLLLVIPTSPQKAIPHNIPDLISSSIPPTNPARSPPLPLPLIFRSKCNTLLLYLDIPINQFNQNCSHFHCYTWSHFDSFYLDFWGFD